MTGPGRTGRYDRLAWDSGLVTDTTGPPRLSGLTAAVLRWARQHGAGRRLESEYWEMFQDQTPDYPGSAIRWRAAARRGATFEWALRAAGLNEDGAAGRREHSFLVGWALRLAATIPVTVIDGLLADGWPLTELAWLAVPHDRFFPDTARRLVALHQAAPETSGANNALRWHAVAAVLAVDPSGLTDLQALRWLQVIMPEWEGFGSGCLSRWFDPLLRWVEAAGPDGWAWAAAGYTPDQTRVLLALPETDPARPGPEQLTVMAALQQT